MAAPQAEKCTSPESFGNINCLHGNIHSVTKPKYSRSSSAPTPRLPRAQSHPATFEFIHVHPEPNLQENVYEEYKEEDSHESSGYIDLSTIMKSLERLDTEEEHQSVPEELLCLIRRLCKEHQVDSPVWAQSSTDWREIIILGRGVTEIQEQLTKEAKTLHPEFKFVTKESGPLHTHQFRKLFVGQRTADEQSNQWTDAAETRCQLIVSAEDKRDCNSGVARKAYLVTPAHLVLSGGQCDAIIHDTDPNFIKRIRSDVDSKVFQTDYIVDIPTQNGSISRRINLLAEVMIAYRNYYGNISTTTNEEKYRCVAGKCTANQLKDCPHMYMNDIAILSICSDKFKKLRDEVNPDTSFHFDNIASANAEAVEQLIKSKIKFYVDDFECQLLDRVRPVEETAERTYADHVTFKFVAQEGVVLDEGSSGSILYIKHQGRQFAFAMVTGMIAEMTERRYQAILLEPALKEIEMDYRHHVADFKPFNFRPRRATRPSTAVTSAIYRI